MTSRLTKTLLVVLCFALFAAVLICTVSPALDSGSTAFAAEENGSDDTAAADATGDKALAAAIAIGLAAAGGAIGMGLSIAKASESIARQPEAKNDIRTTMMLGLVFIETAIIYAVIVAILVVFVL